MARAMSLSSHVSANSKWTHEVRDLVAEVGRFDRHFLAIIRRMELHRRMESHWEGLGTAV